METSQATTSESAELWDMELVTTGRMQNLTDSVFAIAMTLLLLNFAIPASFESQNIPGLFSTLWPQFLTYFLSFMALSTFWVGHHNHFHFIQRSNRTFLWINIFFLSFIVLIPFSTGVLRSFYNDELAIGVYGTNLIICGIGMYWYWWYATKNHRLVSPDLSEKIIRVMKGRILIPILLTVITILCSLISPLLSLFMFFLIFILATAPTNTDPLFERFTKYLHTYLKI